MQKDVIYIDVDDDITAIIDKVKHSSHKIIALVPPKRTGVLQSAVNLRLINRAASQKDKRLVVITNDTALASLAAAASIPVAKNLQSKPELAEVTALHLDDDDDIIDGAELPIGDHARQGSSDGKDPAVASDVASAGLITANETRKATPPVGSKQPKVKAKKGKAVPNFDKFRKKLVLIILAVLLLIGFLVWAIFFAPNAKITVATRTTDAAVSQQVTLDPSADTSASNSIVRATTKSETEDISVDFTGSGEKEVGEFATGTVEFSTRDIERLGSTIPAGTTLSSGSGATYETDSDVTFTLENYRGASTGIIATDRGSDFNGADGSVSGAPNGVRAEITEATSGGTDKTVKVATSSDIERARDEARGKIDEDAARAELEEQLGDGFIVLNENLQVESDDLKSSVKANDELSGTATYGGEVTYTLYAVAESELDEYLKAVIEQQIDNTDEQRVYESGASEVQFTNIDRTEGGLRATLETNGKIGPKIEEDQVKEAASGKRIGDIKSAIESINGVESVDVELTPFWVSTAPENFDKMTVEFRLNDE